MTPDELWEKYKCIVTHEASGECEYITSMDDFLAALREYGQAVRNRDAQVCIDRFEADPKNLLRTAIITDCAAAIEREPLP